MSTVSIEIHPNNRKVVDELLATKNDKKINIQLENWKRQSHESEACRQRIMYHTMLTTGVQEVNTKQDTEEVIPKENLPFEVRVAQRYSELYLNAVRRGKEFNLTFTDVKRLMSRKTCAYTGERFSNEGGTRMTFERVDGTKGYVKGNVIAVTFEANQLKNALFENKASAVLTTPKQLRKMLAVIEKHTGE